MRILLVNDRDVPGGGAEQVVFNTKKLLEDNNHNVQIFKIGLDYNLRPRFFNSFLSFHYFFRMLNSIKKFNPDIIHVHNICNITPSILIAAKLFKKPILMTVHDPYLICPKEWGIYQNKKICPYLFGWRCLIANCETPWRGYKFTLYYWNQYLRGLLHRFLVKKYVNKFIFVSKYYKNIFEKSLNISNNNSVYLPNFVFNFKREYIEARAAKEFIFMGRLSKQNGASIAIRAFDILVNQKGIKDIKLKIFGKGKELGQLKHLVKEKKLRNNVFFQGYVSNNQVHTCYRKACALIVPSRWMVNGQLVLLEALVNKTPIIATGFGGFLDVVEHGKNGFLFEIGNPHSLAKQIEKLYDNLPLSKKFGERGCQKFIEEFSPEKHYQGLMNLYLNTIYSIK